MQIEAGKYYRTRDGRKVGPMVANPLIDYPFKDGSGFMSFTTDGHRFCADEHHTDIIAEWTEAPTGPVRTVTRKEIVPGVYGRVRVYDETCEHGHVCMGLPASYHWTAPELRAAVATLSEIADALEGGAV